ncbi:MAG TPA: MBL fold metallo-hydrolase [Actinophytocola sp.]|uniref:MBL fold metallo-hydrolase n=1 Tax=Actinophytocola sp. TaxID=1872138 RepID=UPI002DDCCBBA|nr:MBL fold metallo-hydrolase [Actinophytocola sp.]HEV2782543.1 MBL fold metallo-hydrolase [Actinophytocola sp.]
MRLTLLGVGAMSSPRYRPAGLLLSAHGWRVMFDGGMGAEPDRHIDAWLVTDARAELIREIRRLARTRGTAAAVAGFVRGTLRVEPQPVVHTAHPTYGYLIDDGRGRAVWAPEFWEFPAWAQGADLMFADAAGWNRPIRFAGNAGGHACVADTARAAREHGVRRLVFAHIGRPSIHAIDLGVDPPFGEWGVEGRRYQLR